MTAKLELLFASSNKGKFAEVLEIASQFTNLKITSPNELILKCGAVPEIDEIGVTYEENALLKARGVFTWSKTPSFADDAGLEVEALNYAPGLYSARYAGEPSDPTRNREKLLLELKNTTDRNAAFVSVLCLFGLAPEPIFVKAKVEGTIILKEEGCGGFGYDPLFKPNGHNETLATLKEKNIPVDTHRTKSVRMLFEELQSKGLLK